MKGKTKTYMLLILVLGIWGVFGYKVLSSINPKTPKIAQQDFEVLFNPKSKIENDTFSIQLTEKDPFLGTLYINKKSVVKKSNKSETVWEPIIYHGIVSQQQSKNQVFIISINGQQYLMKVRQEINDIKLIRGNNKTIVVSYKDNKKSISKYDTK